MGWAADVIFRNIEPFGRAGRTGLDGGAGVLWWSPPWVPGEMREMMGGVDAFAG